MRQEKVCSYTLQCGIKYATSKPSILLQNIAFSSTFSGAFLTPSIIIAHESKEKVVLMSRKK